MLSARVLILLFLTFIYLVFTKNIYAVSPIPTPTDDIAPGSIIFNNFSQDASKYTVPPTPTPNSTSSSTNSVPATSQNWGAAQQAPFTLDNMMGGTICFLGGFDPYGACPVQNGPLVNGRIQVMLYNQIPGDGAIGAANNLMISLYNHPPTSTSYYLANLGNSIGITNTAYAASGPDQGSGSSLIVPVYKIWTFTRNMAYVLIIFIIIAVGFMIMFRSKINPQTTISIQSAIPRIVISLALITFSYFIASLLIDISFFGVQIIAQLFLQAQNQAGANNAFDVNSVANNSNIFQLLSIAQSQSWNVGEIMTAIWNVTLNAAGNNFAQIGHTGNIAGAIGSIVTGLILGVGGLIGGTLGGILIPLILMIVFFIQTFRLLWSLLNAYITILIYTVIGPFLILYSAIPGKGGVLTNWWKTILGNSLIFPAVIAVFLFSGVILGTPSTDWNGARPPLLNFDSGEILRLVISYGLLIGLPAIPGMVKELLGIKDIQGIPGAAMAGAMAGVGVVQAGVNLTQIPATIQQRRLAWSRYNAGVDNAPAPRTRTGATGRYAFIRNLPSNIVDLFGGQGNGTGGGGASH